MRTKTFKTKLFAKAARKARISDAELCVAMSQVALGQADDLGGGVFKKRLDENRHRSIILARAGRLWVYEYLFAKKDRASIDDDELAGFRKLAKAYVGMTDQQMQGLVETGHFEEICHDQQA